MDFLSKNNVHIRDREKVEKIISELVKGGSSQLQVVTDFDHTLSRTHLNGVNCPSTYGILDSSPLISEKYRTDANALNDYYYPIELDPNMSKEEKVPYMIEWFEKNIGSMPSCGLTKSLIPELVSSSNLALRDGCDKMFESLHQHNVPVLVLSAGLGDLVREGLLSNKVLLPNVKIVANFMKFDDKGNLIGIEGDIVHTFNKNQSSAKNQEYFKVLEKRKNVILLGDSVGDLDMADGIENLNVILKIGFLNFKIEESLSKYMEGFDIVIADDQSMDVPNAILKYII